MRECLTSGTLMNDRIGIYLAKKRVSTVIPFIRGRLLDIGCGTNILIRTYGNGIGVDVHDWGDVDQLVSDSANLPFPDLAFNTVTIIAALNHIPNRREVLKECKRLLAPGGRLIITMLSPWISRIWHMLRSPWDTDQRERGMKEGEVYGITKKNILSLVAEQGFEMIGNKRFMLGLNSIYLFKKKDK